MLDTEINTFELAYEYQYPVEMENNNKEIITLLQCKTVSNIWYQLLCQSNFSYWIIYK